MLYNFFNANKPTGLYEAGERFVANRATGRMMVASPTDTKHFEYKPQEGWATQLMVQLIHLYEEGYDIYSEGDIASTRDGVLFLSFGRRQGHSTALERYVEACEYPQQVAVINTAIRMKGSEEARERGVAHYKMRLGIHGSLRGTGATMLLWDVQNPYLWEEVERAIMRYSYPTRLEKVRGGWKEIKHVVFRSETQGDGLSQTNYSIVATRGGAV